MSQVRKKLHELSNGKTSNALKNMQWRKKNRWWIRIVNKVWIYGGVFRPLVTPLLKYTKPPKNDKN